MAIDTNIHGLIVRRNTSMTMSMKTPRPVMTLFPDPEGVVKQYDVLGLDTDAVIFVYGLKAPLTPEYLHVLSDH